MQRVTCDRIGRALRDVRVFGGTLLASLLSCTASGQPARAFDIADVHVSATFTNPDTFVTGGILRDGRYDLRRATMLDLIGLAWRVDADKVVGGPGWLALDRFDIAARAPQSTSPEMVNLMLQALLADRFQLALHKDTRPLPAFALTTGTGKPKMKESDGSGRSGCQPQPQSGATTYSVVSCHNVSMEAFAGTLRRIAGDYLTEPVVDATSLPGTWDFDLKWNPRSRVLPAGAERITIFDAIEKQLGLTLGVKQIPTPVIVVERVNEKPTGNPPGIAEKLPLLSPVFEVASIKPSAPDERFGYRRYPSGRLEIHAFPMKMLIATAWDVDWDHMDDRIAAPKWVDSKRFDIVAKTSAAPDAPRGTGMIDQDLELMLRALLTDRFRMSTHYEDRPVPSYTLTAAGPKLRKADPANRAGCKEARTMAHDPRDLNPRLSRLIQCRNITMAQFAQQLRSMDRVEAAFNDVVDETGLKGAYDFTISFTPRSQLQNRDADPQSSAGFPAASEPNGAVSFFDALRQQLGLRLEMRRRPMPVLIVDHVEENPAEN